MRQISLKQIGLLVTIAVVAAACGRNSAPQLDDALKHDLALASQTQSYDSLRTTSPYEASYASQKSYAPRATSTVARQASSVRRAPARRASSSSSSSSSGGGGYYPAPTPPTTIEKHTQRDAAIGAVAGAVIGATTSRKKIQGGLIGAAIGGILGGVVGNNVDIKRKTGW
jgi:hypothetical protein